MNTIRLNRRVLITSTFDSGALGVLAYVVHQFPEGRYHLVVHRDGQEAGSTGLLVENSSANMQLEIDLASGETSTSAEVPTVSQKGYVLFYVSGDAGGYSVVTRRESDPTPVFDSTTLSENDLFAVSLLEPATYSMANQTGNATGEIQVTPIPEGTNPSTLPTLNVDVNSASFDPANVSLHSTQGLVFRIKNPARVVINKQPGAEPSAGPPPSASASAEKRVRRRVHLRRPH